MIAQTEFQREQTNVLAVGYPYREIEELPEGLETGHVKRRKRGDGKVAARITSTGVCVTRARANYKVQRVVNG